MNVKRKTHYISIDNWRLFNEYWKIFKCYPSYGSWFVSLSSLFLFAVLCDFLSVWSKSASSCVKKWFSRQRSLLIFFFLSCDRKNKLYRIILTKITTKTKYSTFISKYCENFKCIVVAIEPTKIKIKIKKVRTNNNNNPKNEKYSPFVGYIKKKT